MRNAWLSGFILLACCADEKSPETRFRDKLRDCDLLSEGTFQVEIDPEEDKCPLKCFEQASCSDLSHAYCDGDGEGPSGGFVSGATTYETCIDACSDADAFECKDHSGVEAYRCDGILDCDDESDEDDCPADSFFVCGSGERVPKDYACDGEDDCEDGSDEKDCPADAIFVCKNGEQVPEDYACDGEDDCEDGSDEKDCPADAFFSCEGGGSVPKDYVCDGEEDCEDGSDEDQHCAKLQCGG